MGAGFNYMPQNGENCVANLGIPYTTGGKTPTPNAPITYYYNPAGQIAGVGVTVWGKQFTNDFWKRASDKDIQTLQAYAITLSFRDPSAVCGAGFSPFVLGNQLVVNQGQSTGSMPIPTSWADAMAVGGWDTYGSAWTGMGVHSSYNLDPNAVAGQFSNDLNKMMPVIAMFQVIGIFTTAQPS